MRWYNVTNKDGSRWLARRDERAGLVVVMAARGISHKLISAADARRDFERGEVYHDQALADEQYRLARAGPGEDTNSRRSI